MRITGFNPMVVSKDAKNLIALFEELGFERRHQPVADAGKGDVQSTRMGDANGNRIDIIDWAEQERDLCEIRINVDDLEEAYAIFTAHGFKNTRAGDQTVDLSTSNTAVMISPSGLMVSLVKHIK